MSSATPPWASPSWTVSFTTPTAFNSPEKACESRTPAINLLTQTQTPEPITMSVEAAAHDRVKYTLTIKRNERSPSREIDAHNQRNAQNRTRGRIEKLLDAAKVERLRSGDNPAAWRGNLKFVFTSA